MGPKPCYRWNQGVAGGPRYLRTIAHPSVGVRIPEILLAGILRAFKRCRVAGGLELSFGRETAPQRVIESPPGVYDITQGHTGTSITRYMTMSSSSASKIGASVEIEADHLIVVGSAAKAIKRISGVHEESRINQRELERSLAYNKEEIDEALSTNAVNAFTTDTSDLINLDVDKWDDDAIVRQFNHMFTPSERRRLRARYLGKKFTFAAEWGKRYSYRLSEKEVMRLALKFRESIRINREIYDYIIRRMRKPFGFEISLDETRELTREVETLFYLSEWGASGARVDFLAPNIGFLKRRDYRGDLEKLRDRVSKQAAIARKFGALLSIHSGSGTSPYSGKGRGTYAVLLQATGGELKYKISGVYMELLFEILASYPARSPERSLYDAIFDAVHEYVRKDLESGGSLSSPLVRRQLQRYDRAVKAGAVTRRSSRAEFFRFNSFLALNLRDAAGRRVYREQLVKLYREGAELRRRIDNEVERLTVRLIRGLHFENNVDKLVGRQLG